MTLEAITAVTADRGVDFAGVQIPSRQPRECVDEIVAIDEQAGLVIQHAALTWQHWRDVRKQLGQEG
jgi:hypothetical protein